MEKNEGDSVNNEARFELEEGFFRHRITGLSGLIVVFLPLCPLCSLWSIPLHSGSYLPKVAQGFEDAFDLAGALGAFAAELGRECFGGGGGVGGNKLPDKSDLFGQAGGPNWSFQVGVFRFQWGSAFGAGQRGLIGGRPL